MVWLIAVIFLAPPAPQLPPNKSCKHSLPFLQWSQKSWHGLENLFKSRSAVSIFCACCPSSLSHNCNVAKAIPERLFTQVQLLFYFAFRSKWNLVFCTLITLWYPCALHVFWWMACFLAKVFAVVKYMWVWLIVLLGRFFFFFFLTWAQRETSWQCHFPDY